ncbi:type II toxin-antitoxin system RelE/ParE family toxin [Candidatus Woesearchaeota archaeon]|nr:type II toxin-antitoxin system RelE/ParE family toxin [Candidatus Woesearchaeota archaeon]
MMWDVYLSPDIQNFLNKQDKHIAERIKKGLQKLKTENPFHYLEHFEGRGYYKYRIGEYRALVDVDFENKILKVQVLDHRRVIYKRKK